METSAKNAEKSQRSSLSERSVSKIWNNAQEYVHCLRPIIQYHFPSDQISEHDLEQIAASATAFYLMQWFRRAHEVSDTLYNLAHTRYQEFQEESLAGYGDVENSLFKRLKNCAKRFCKMNEACEIQSREEGTLWRPIPYSYSERSHRYSDIDLVGIHHMMTHGDNLIDLFYSKKNPLTNTSDQGSNKSLENACKNMILDIRKAAELPKSIESLRDSRKLKVCKQFIAASMYVTEFEEAARPVLIAKFLIQASAEKFSIYDDSDGEKRAWAQYLWGRYYYKRLESFSAHPEQKVIFQLLNNQISSDYSFLNYDRNIKWFLEGYSLERRNIIFSERMLFSSTIAVLHHTYPFDKESTKTSNQWSENDYWNALRFYTEEFPILESFKSLDFPDRAVGTPNPNSKSERIRRTKDFYDDYRKLFLDYLSFKNRTNRKK